MDLTESLPLTVAIKDVVGQPLRLDASAVDHLGALCLQVLIAAARQWQADQIAFEIAPMSEAFIKALHNFGLPGSALTEEAA
ncbi:STAS domain-containing protein [Paracoccus cavernae]|uniref:STAS domain-containing protein n=2 Tax=Paracoccus cavernae TaxID=1571207 RepID=A0ABT8D8G0_9RHOB|nr:STAS domain-containing protein [Paracoccus cavernae]